jgi:uncharacterized LabA/DUF88 family protein
MADAISRPDVAAFFDVQNLFRNAKEAFGHHHPNFDPVKLTKAVCLANDWSLKSIHFYTGIPDSTRDPSRAGYWNNRVMALKRAGVQVTTRKLRYHESTTYNAEGKLTKFVTAQEKGIDVRLALDLVKFARQRKFDVAMLFSQDQDLSEVVTEVREIAVEQSRSIQICCPFPSGSKASNRRGVNGTKWFPLSRTFYDACLDPHDYRPNRKAN